MTCDVKIKGLECFKGMHITSELRVKSVHGEKEQSYSRFGQTLQMCDVLILKECHVDNSATTTPNLFCYLSN